MFFWSKIFSFSFFSITFVQFSIGFVFFITISVSIFIVESLIMFVSIATFCIMFFRESNIILITKFTRTTGMMSITTIMQRFIMFCITGRWILLELYELLLLAVFGSCTCDYFILLLGYIFCWFSFIIFIINFQSKNQKRNNNRKRWEKLKKIL